MSNHILNFFSDRMHVESAKVRVIGPAWAVLALALMFLIGYVVTL